MMITLSAKQRRFVNEYCVDPDNATQAAIRAGYSPTVAAEMGSENLRKPHIASEIKKRMEELAVTAGVTPEWVVNQWVKIASADPNELVQVRQTACRNCYGIGNEYQWTEAEYYRAVEAAVDAGKPAPDAPGGFGFDLNAAPSEGCPECGGAGVSDVHVVDSRRARSPLYAGAERSRHGIKINLRDRDAALANLARYLGMMIDRKEVSGPGGAPIASVRLSADDLTDDQLAAIIKTDADEE